MKCPRCAQAGDKSAVYAPGGSFSTLMAHRAYWDEDGIYHSHDPNWHSSEYGCSKRHRWLESWLPECPAGDYGERKTKDLDPLPISPVWQVEDDGKLTGPFLTPAP